ncbi:MAG: hypothetical protein Q7R85_00280 [bacterium]|nr:hypothetical protein [bacterium]
MKEISHIVKSLLHASGVFLYILGIVGLLSNAKGMFGPTDPPFPLAPLFMLLLFIISATITGSLVLGKPIYLYLEHRKKEAFIFLCSTLVWLTFFLAVVAAAMLAF